jgi:hypothetical protein
MYAEDERRAWLQLFKETGEIIPCPSCKQHYQDYLAAHPITALKTLALRDMNAWITTWFWTLHNDINTRLEKPIFLKDDLLTTYNRVNLRSALTMVDAPIRLAIKLTGTNLLKYIEWRKRYGILLSMYGI